MTNPGIKALTRMPHVTADEWKTLSTISRWLIATRAAVLIMTFISAAIAGLVAFRHHEFRWPQWLALAFGLMFAHATNNLLNDRSDFLRGVDKNNYYRTQYGIQPLASGVMTLRQNLVYAAITAALAVACGLPLVLANGIWGWALLASGAFFVLCYTWPLKYFAMGELAVFLVWGPLMVAGGHFVIANRFEWDAVLACVPYALGVTAVIFGKHIDKRAEDKEKRIFTLPVVLGDRLSRAILGATAIVPYFFVAGMVLFGGFHPVLLVVLFALPALKRALPVFLSDKPATPELTPVWYEKDLWPNWYVALAFYHNRAFGVWFMIGLFADAVISFYLN
jgi:1,4-dihydroxy-2-naphthoate octaprenyltransferase